MRISVLVAATAASVMPALPAFAQFSPGPNPVTGTVGGQSLTSSTGTVNAGGAISTSGGTLALAFSGTATLVNNGTIQQTGTGRAIDSNSGTANLTVTNNGLISAVSADAFRINTAGTSVLLNNSGTIRVTAGGQAIDWAAITTGSNTLNNLLGGVITAVNEDAVRPGQNGIVNNAGTISATPVVTDGDASGSDGIDLRVGKTVTVTNTGTISGRHGIATDGANAGPSSLTVNNNAGVIEALNGSGINVDGAFTNVVANVTNLFGATIRGGLLSTTLQGDGDGIDVDGVLTLNNSGDVLGLGAKGASNNAEGIAAGGGTITNTSTGRIIGTSLVPNGDSTRAGNGILIDDSNGGSAVAATSITNGGLIQGVTGFAVRMIGNFSDTVTNLAGGTLQGAGSGAAIQTGGGADIVTNRGTIVSETGNAINLEGGNDQLMVEGGAASIVGNVSGGAGSNTATLDPGAGNTFAYAGVLSNFDTVEVASGTVTLSGASTYTGTTVISGGALQLDGVNRLAADSSLDLAGGTLEILNASVANAQTFGSLALSADSTIDLNGASLTFSGLAPIADAALTVLDFYVATSPEYAFRLLGDFSLNQDFLSLIGATTINGFAATFRFDGTYTNVAPVPLPAAWLLFMSGIGLMGGASRWRRGALNSAAA